MRLVYRGLNGIKQGWFALWGPGSFPSLQAASPQWTQWSHRCMYPNDGSSQSKIWSTEQCLPTTGRIPKCHVYFLFVSFWVLVFIFKSLTILLTVQIQTRKLFFSPQPPAVLEIQNAILDTKTEINVGGFVKILQIDQSKNSWVLSNEHLSHLQTLASPSYLKY